MTVWVAFLLSRLLRFLLEEGHLSSHQVARGVPYVVSTMLHVVILLVGLSLWVAAMDIRHHRVQRPRRRGFGNPGLVSVDRTSSTTSSLDWSCSSSGRRMSGTLFMRANVTAHSGAWHAGERDSYCGGF